MLRQVIRGAWRYRYPACSPRCCNTTRPLLRRPFSASASQYDDRNLGPGDKIRFFEQDTVSSKERVEVNPDAEDAADRDEIKKELDKLDDDLEILKKGPFDADSPFMKSLPEKDRIIALEAFRKYDAEHGQDGSDDGPGLEQIFDQELDDMIKEEFKDLHDEAEENADPKNVLSTEEESETTPSQGHPYEIRFYNILEQVANEPDTSKIQMLWRWYLRCKNSVPSFLESLSPEIFQLLWKAQIQDQKPSANQLNHVQALVKDIKSVGRDLSPDETLEFIGIVHSAGDTERALQMWEEQQTAISNGEGNIDAYWNLGVRLFAAYGDPQRAQDIAFAFLSRNEGRSARILIPIIMAWIEQGEKDAPNKAWASYLQLRTLLGFDMKMKDYDEITISFLKSGHINLALAVFKDMMVTGKDPSNDSTQIFQKAIGLAGNMHAMSIRAEDVNKISLSALTILPRRFQNKFFYASWMKKLIGMGEVDSAASVVELMFERGIRPDAIHLNGIIGGWLRHGTTYSRDKAERLGWAMIQHRIDTVWARLQPFQESPKLDMPEVSDGIEIPKFLDRGIPPANIETFSILLLHYTRRGDDGMIRYLNKCLGDAQIKPNSYFMNHLLYAELRKHNIDVLWKEFKSMAAYVRPDLETFACLWDCGKLQYDRSRKEWDPEFPSARQLFSLMMQWFSTLNPQAQQSAQAEFSRELYDQITLCFSLSKDPCGTLVSLYAMRDLFGHFPDEQTARMLVLQITRLSGIPARTPRKARRRLFSTPGQKEKAETVQSLLRILESDKAAMLQEQGLTIDQLSDEERKQYQLEILSDLLVSIIERTVGGKEQVKEQLVVAMEEMGISLDLPLLGSG
ncbi:uncharacterized protein TRUGW13939_01091 [Talaromyces rugulosus]|uniref:Pentatricopeptide repeat protein n=1 Tax=Talaromyces rugulosus TaxID=121627 RepID=A0A7H8QJ82_TALRU|nr:uncharacterized protein TRUGW13939_01091 [Talaromyces rugulosus]QKX54009.1 hypothetical protein TRUGW13939_01091 [Talaromyces rugulosus]